MRDFKIAVDRGSTYQIELTHKNMMSAIALFVMTYGDKGLEKIDDKGISLSTEIYIESVDLDYESE